MKNNKNTNINIWHHLIKHFVWLHYWLKPKKTVLVLGMHRCGTSMTASVIQSLGVNIGDNLLPAKEGDNRLGYFEECEFISINDQILSLAGGNLVNPPSKENIIKAARILDEQITNVINKRSSLSLWGWKDPRTSLTFDAYLHKLKNPFIIVCRRSNKAVADSLIKRDPSIDRKFAEDLADKYNQSIDDVLSRMPFLPRLILNYDNVIDEPKKSVYKVGLFLNIIYSRNKYKEAISKILRDERHNYTYYPDEQISYNDSPIPQTAINI